MGHRAFDAWYVSQLGQSPDTNLVSPLAADHVLVGPVPASLVPYRSLAGAEVHMPNVDHIIKGTAQDRHAEVERLHRQAMERAVGGDLSTLDPIVLRNP